VGAEALGSFQQVHQPADLARIACMKSCRWRRRRRRAFPSLPLLRVEDASVGSPVCACYHIANHSVHSLSSYAALCTTSPPTSPAHPLLPNPRPIVNFTAQHPGTSRRRRRSPCVPRGMTHEGERDWKRASSFPLVDRNSACPSALFAARKR
jgi:hypothetical protein